MAIPSAFPDVYVSERDYSHVPSLIQNLVGAAVIDAPWGPADPQFIGTANDLWKKYTLDGKYKRGYPTDLLEATMALYGMGLWVVRAVGTGALYGGAAFVKEASDSDSASLGSGVDDPSSYTFQADEILLIYANSPGVATRVTVQVTGYNEDVTGEVLGTGDGSVTDFSGTLAHYPVKASSISVAYTISSTAYTATDDGNGVISGTNVTGTIDYTTGAWTLTFATAPDASTDVTCDYTVNNEATVKAPDCNLLQVYLDGDEVERYIVSLLENGTDPDGHPCFVETILQRSNYVRALVKAGNAEKYVKSPVSALSLGGGSAGSAVTVGDRETALDKLNPETYSIIAVADMGVADSSYLNYLAQFAQTKRALAVCSVPYDQADVTSTLDYANGLTVTGDTASYAALYANWLKVYQKDISDYIYVSPTGFALQTIGYTWANYEPWYPPAGWRRGGILAVGLAVEMTKGEMGQLYDARVNPIRFKAGKGLAFWGQKTLYPYHSARDRMNVRLLLNYFENIGAEFLEGFLFELNNEDTWYRVQSGLIRLCDNIKARGGIESYDVPYPGDVTSAIDIDNNIMRVPVGLSPTRSVEYIPFVVNVLKTGDTLKVFANIA